MGKHCQLMMEEELRQQLSPIEQAIWNFRDKNELFNLLRLSLIDCFGKLGRNFLCVCLLCSLWSPMPDCLVGIGEVF